MLSRDFLLVKFYDVLILSAAHLTIDLGSIDFGLAPKMVSLLVTEEALEKFLITGVTEGYLE